MGTVTSLLSIVIQSLENLVLNDATTGICGIVARTESDMVKATHANLYSVLDAADVVGPAMRAGDS
jgi:hypothetical protein